MCVYSLQVRMRTDAVRKVLIARRPACCCCCCCCWRRSRTIISQWCTCPSERNNFSRLQNERFPYRKVLYRTSTVSSVWLFLAEFFVPLCFIYLIDSSERVSRVLPSASVLVVPYYWYARLRTVRTRTPANRKTTDFLAPMDFDRRWFIHSFVRVPYLLRCVYSTVYRATISPYTLLFG